MYTNGKAISLTQCGHKKGRSDGLDPCHRKKKLAYRKRSRLSTPCGKDEPGKLPRFNTYCSYRAKSLHGSPAGLNHPRSEVENKLVFARITHRESINDN